MLGILVVAQHHAVAAAEDLPLVGDLEGHPGARLAHSPDLVRPEGVVEGGVGVVLGHAPGLGDLDAYAVIPLEQRRGHRGRAAAQHPRLIQPQPLLQLALDETRDERDLEQQRQLLLGQLLVDLDAEHGPQPRHRDEDGGSAALDVLDEGVEGFGEGDGGTAEQAAAVDVDPLGDVGERQVGEAAIRRRQGDRLHQLLAGPGVALHAQHGPLGLAGAARGVNQAQQGIRCLHRAVRDGVMGIEQRVPLVGGRHGVIGQRYAQQIRGHPRLLALPVVQLADEDGLGLAVAQHVFDGVDVGGRVDGHAHVLPHLHGEIGDEPLCAILGEQGHLVPRDQPQGTQCRHHAAGLVGDLTPGEVDVFAVDGLAKIDPVGTLPLPVIEHLERQFGGNA
ncbi:hypothetical protein D3C75_374170 [compost metagenome]